MSVDEAGVTTRPVRLAQAVVAVLIAIKLCIAIFSPPIGDEAYYWMWGQKLDWSYFDHPPLHAWLLRLMNLIFGWNLFSLRILTWATLGGTLAIIWLWSRRLKPEDPATWFWPSTALYLASPMFLWTSSIAFHDHLLTFLCLASGHLFLVFAEKWEASGKHFVWLYAAAATLALATLTKYNAALLGVGIAAFFIARPALRPLWRSPHLYLAALLSVAMQAPVFWWNFTQGFSSYRFHLGERWGDNMLAFKPWLALSFVGLTVALVGPFLFPAIVRFLRAPLSGAFVERARQLGLWVFVVSTLTMGVMSFFVSIFFYWNIVAFILMMPLLAGWMKWPRIARAHYVFGILVALVYGYHVIVNPAGDWTIQSTFGWHEVGERIRVLEAEYAPDFIATTRYTTAAQLGFAMGDADVVAIAQRHDQYDIWFDPGAHRGETALVVTDDLLGLGGVAPHFATLTQLEVIDIARFGQNVYRVGIYLGRDFGAAPAAQQ